MSRFMRSAWSGWRKPARGRGPVRLALLAVAVTFGGAFAQSLPTGASKPAPASYVDVVPEHWAADAITRLTALGVLTGYPDGSFGGSRAATRYELAVVAARLVDLFSNSLVDLVSDPLFRRALEDAAAAGERLERLEAVVGDGATGQDVRDLAARIAMIEEYLNEQAGERLFPGLSPLPEAGGDPFLQPLTEAADGADVARILSELEQQLAARQALQARRFWFGMNAGYPVATAAHVGMRDVLPNTHLRFGVGFAFPGAFSMTLDAFYEFSELFAAPQLSTYLGGGLHARIGGGQSSLDAVLLAGLEYALGPASTASIFIEAGPALSLAPAFGSGDLVARAGLNLRF